MVRQKVEFRRIVIRTTPLSSPVMAPLPVVMVPAEMPVPCKDEQVILLPDRVAKATEEITKHDVAEAASMNPPVALPESQAYTLFKRSTTGVGWKQWSIWVEGNDVVTEWGHCDHTKQGRRASFGTHFRAKTYYQNRIHAKRHEGYRSIQA